MAALFILAIVLLQAKSPLLLLLAYACHEAGHMLCAIICRADIPVFSIKPGGFVLYYPGIYGLPSRLAVCLSGPAVSLALGLFLPHGSMLSLYSLGLCAVNLLPTAGLDGGEAFSAVCYALAPPASAWRICRITSVFTILLLFAFNCAIQLKTGINLSLLAVTLYLTVSIIGRDA